MYKNAWCTCNGVVLLIKGSSRQPEQFNLIFRLHGTVQYFCWVHTQLTIQVKFEFDSTQRPGATLKGDAFDGRTPLAKQHAFLHISLPLLHDYDVKLPYFTISRLNGGQELKDNDFIFVFFTLIRHLPSILSEPACQPVQSYREFPY